MRIVKRLSTAATMAVVLATSLGVSSAVANEPRFEAAQYPVKITGKQEEKHVFTFGPRKISCEIGTLEQPTLSGPDSNLNLSVGYSGCTNVTLPAVIKTNSCIYSIHILSSPPFPYSGVWNVLCPGGSTLEFILYSSAKNQMENKPLCTYKVGYQDLADIVYTHSTYGWPGPSWWSVRAKFAIEGIAFSVTGSSLLCGQSKTDGTFTGSSLLAATNSEGKPVDFKWSSEY